MPIFPDGARLPMAEFIWANVDILERNNADRKGSANEQRKKLKEELCDVLNALGFKFVFTVKNVEERWKTEKKNAKKKASRIRDQLERGTGTNLWNL